MTKSAKKIPAYLTKIYKNLYLNSYLYNFLDNGIIQNILTLGYHNTLTDELKKEISPHSKILQIGATFGSQIDKTYSALGMLGSYTIIDILPNVIENCKEKHLDQRINFIEANAKNTIKEEYDTIICYMLLHELPPLTRTKVLENIINSLKTGGKVIFIDYNLPNHYNPLKYIIRAYNRLYQPFAEALWKNNIKDLTPNAEICNWSKQTYFGGIYQKVVATKLK
jgi:ubiquinone/menaquinone biosynthesis C-methylase UbiE